MYPTARMREGLSLSPCKDSPNGELTIRYISSADAATMATTTK